MHRRVSIHAGTGQLYEPVTPLRGEAGMRQGQGIEEAAQVVHILSKD